MLKNTARNKKISMAVAAALAGLATYGASLPVLGAEPAAVEEVVVTGSRIRPDDAPKHRCHRY